MQFRSPTGTHLRKLVSLMHSKEMMTRLPALGATSRQAGSPLAGSTKFCAPRLSAVLADLQLASSWILQPMSVWVRASEWVWASDHYRDYGLATTLSIKRK